MLRPRTSAILLMLALLTPIHSIASVRVPGGGESSQSRGRRPYLRPARRQALIEEAPAPAVLVNNNTAGSGTGNGSKRAATATQQQQQQAPSQASALEMLRRAFLGLGPEPEPAEDGGNKRGPRIPDPAPEIQNPKASPLPVPPMEGQQGDDATAAGPPLVAEEVLSTLPLPRPAGAADAAAAAVAAAVAPGVNMPPRDLRRRKHHRDAGPPPQCMPTLQWTSVNGQLMVNGQPFHLKGTNWFGYETAQRMPFGLDEHDMDFYFQFLAEHQFNALRVPLSVDFALDPDGEPDKEADAKAIDPAIKGLTNFARLDVFLKKAAEHGLLVLLDMHRLDPEDSIPPLWYDDRHTFAQYLQAWDNVLSAFGGKWNVFALDLKNEPHGTASWEAQSPATDWNRAAETIAGHVAAKHPDFRGLFFVEGIDHPTNTGTGSNRAPLDKHSKPWGGDFEGVRARAIDLGEPGLNDRVVYSPHVYGPSVFDRDYFDTKDFPANLPAIWSAQWAFVEQATSRAVVLGEWGGKNEADGPVGDRDRVWHNALADFLVAQCMEDTFYWCLNPNSGDTNGLLLDDWTTPDADKLDLLARVQPHPSAVSLQGDQICVVAGEYANPACVVR